MKFLEWFITDKIQQKWAELGGYTCSKAVLAVGGVPKCDAVQ